MNADVFIDTNILVYAHDRDAGWKHQIARDCVKELWLSKCYPAISVQVLQELFVNLRRLGLSVEEARAIAHDYAVWRVADNTLALCLRAIDEVNRWQVSYWDGLILAAARAMGVDTLWTEDLNEHQDYGGIRVLNPLKR